MCCAKVESIFCTFVSHELACVLHFPQSQNMWIFILLSPPSPIIMTIDRTPRCGTAKWEGPFFFAGSYCQTSAQKGLAVGHTYRWLFTLGNRLGVTNRVFCNNAILCVAFFLLIVFCSLAVHTLCITMCINKSNDLMRSKKKDCSLFFPYTFPWFARYGVWFTWWWCNRANRDAKEMNHS